MTLRGWDVILDQVESWVLEVIFGADYHGIHVFCIFSPKISLLVMMVKLKQKVDAWGLPCLFTFCEMPIFL